MGRPLAPTLVWKATHFAFRCRVKDGGRPWVPLPPGLTKEAAAAMALEIATMASAGELVMAAAKAPVTKAETFSQWSERWLEARQARGLATVRNDRSRLTTHVLPVLGDRPMVKVSKAEIEDLVSRLDARVQARTMSWKTALNVWGAVTKLFDDAANAKDRTLRVRDDNPCKDVRGPERGVRKVKVFLYPSEVSALLTCDAVPLVFRQASALAIYLGVRAGELRSLTWDDVDMNHGTVHVHRGFDRDTHAAKSTKSKTGRRFTFDAEVRPLLEALRKVAKGKGPVLNIPRFYKTADDLRQHLRTAGVTRADLFVTDETRKNLTFHDLRATALTWMAVRGDDVLRIKARAGHADLKQTEGYVRTAGEIEGSIGRVFAPLPACVVLGMDQTLGHYSPENAGNMLQNAVAEEGLEPPTSTPKGPQSPAETAPADSTSPEHDRGFSTLDRSPPVHSDPVEAALAEALAGATVAGRWDVVKALADELTARRNARAGVVDLEAVRRERGAR